MKKSDPETVNDTIIISYLMINLLAGAETTAVPLRSVFYYILQQPAVWARLRQGLDTIVKDKIKPVTWRDARLSPYLEVVMREATRMLPGVAMNLERYVPEGGLVIPPVPTSGGNRNDAPAAVAENGMFFPAGTIVGINPYVMACNTSVYGADVDVFWPEHWQGVEEPEPPYHVQLIAMNAADLRSALARASASARTSRCCRRTRQSRRWSSAMTSSWRNRRRSGASPIAGSRDRRTAWTAGSMGEQVATDSRTKSTYRVSIYSLLSMPRQRTRGGPP